MTGKRLAQVTPDMVKIAPPSLPPDLHEPLNPGLRSELTREAIALKIGPLNGNLDAIARALGSSRRTVKRIIDSDPALLRAWEDAREGMIDNAESALYRGVIGGQAWAVCCVEGTLVTTPDGDRAIESIVPGDEVLTHTGHMRRVEGIHSRHYAGPTITLKAMDWPWLLQVTPEHPILSVRAADRDASAIVFRPASDLRVGDYVHVMEFNAFGALEAWSSTPYDGYVYNLQVAEDASYVANGITTHNCFFLKTQGRKRGYIERAETFNLNVNLDMLTIEQLERLAAGEHPSLVLGSDAAGDERIRTIDAVATAGASGSGPTSEADADGNDG